MLLCDTWIKRSFLNVFRNNRDVIWFPFGSTITDQEHLSTGAFHVSIQTNSFQSEHSDWYIFDIFFENFFLSSGSGDLITHLTTDCLLFVGSQKCFFHLLNCGLILLISCVLSSLSTSSTLTGLIRPSALESRVTDRQTISWWAMLMENCFFFGICLLNNI